MKPIIITETNFQEEVINSEIPVLIDFWAVWCGPCKAIAPIVEEIAEEYDGRLKVGKSDVDSNPRISSTYGIRSIPTLLIFKNGQVVDSVIGMVKKSMLIDKINNHIS